MADMFKPHDWEKLVVALRQLSELVAPLEAILAQEQGQWISEQIEEYITHVKKIADLMATAVSSLEQAQHQEETLKEILQTQRDQAASLTTVQQDIQKILSLFSGPVQ